MATVPLTKDNFDEVVNNNDVVIIDFWAEWCGPCKTFAPVFEAVSEKYPDVVFGKVDTEDQAELASQFGIRSIPTLMVVREKIILYSKAGAVPAQRVEALLETSLKTDMVQVRDQIASAEAEQSSS